MNTSRMSAEEILACHHVIVLVVYLDGVQAALVEWLPESGGVRVDMTAVGMGLYGERDTTLTMLDGVVKRIRPPRSSWFVVGDLRRAMVEPGRGAWTWAHLWMEVDEHTEFDWDRRPEFSTAGSPTDYTCLDELERYPREAEHTPEWLAQAVESARTTPPPPPPPDINAGARNAITEQERDARNRRNRDHD